MSNGRASATGTVGVVPVPAPAVVMGAREVQDLYRQAKNSVESSFEFSDRVPLPDLQGVKEAYIGIANSSRIGLALDLARASARRGQNVV
ncbi:hypothetical protein ACKLTP_18975, partial [Paenarthrobacter ureafaciens]|uniref:hypothetical protein n=1 Tax=Paenarthrobacter ureafaciens TaxID=37931 RepID=UPI00397DE9AE